jgi:hypothetical protein
VETRGKLFERSEFLPRRKKLLMLGEPKADHEGAFFLVRFFGASKEMNTRKMLIKILN